MACFSGLGIGLSFLFGCIFLGLVAEIYYVLWWKKRNANTTTRGIEHHQFYTKLIPHLFSCWKKPISEPTPKTQQTTNSLPNPDAVNAPEPDLELGLTKDLLQQKGYGEEGVEAELIRLHNLCGPPRFLFTINEETKEDLESNDGRSRKGSRTRSFSDFVVPIDTPVLTPLASPTVKGNSNNNPFLDSYNGFNPLFESFSEAEINRVRSSPPPKFKFLRDAEEKLLRKLLEEAQKRANPNSNLGSEEKDGSFVKVIVGKSNKEREATGSQVLPLASSPWRFRPVEFDDKSPVQQ